MQVQVSNDQNYRFWVSDTGVYIEVEVIGDISLEFAIQISKGIDNFNLDKNFRHFLFDVRLAQHVTSSIEMVHLSNQFLKNMSISRSLKAAVLTRPSDNTHDFMRTVLRNAGYNIELFTSRRKALYWLIDLT